MFLGEVLTHLALPYRPIVQLPNMTTRRRREGVTALTLSNQFFASMPIQHDLKNRTKQLSFASARCKFV